MSGGAASDEPERMTKHADELLERYHRNGDVEALRLAQAAYLAAVDRAPVGSDVWLASRDGLGDVEWQLYRHAGSVAPTGSSSLSGWRHNVAQALLERFEQLGSRADLDESITMFEATVEPVGAQAPARAIFLSSLGAALHVRYQVDGQRADM